MFGWLKKKKTKPTIPHAALTMMAHRRSLLACWQRRARGTEDELAGLMGVSEAFGFTPALNLPEEQVPLTRIHLDGLQLSFEEAFEVALKNVGDAVLTQKLSTLDSGVVELRTVDGLAGAALLLNEFIVPQLPLSGPAVAMWPEQDVLLLAASNDTVSLDAMLTAADTAFNTAQENRSLRAVSFSDDGFLQDWLPPDGHPLAERFRTGDALSRYLAALEMHQSTEMPEVVSLAHLCVREPGTLTASWARDTSVIIPADVDRIMLVDTPDSQHAMVELDWARLLELLPDAFEAQVDDEGGDPAAPRENDEGEHEPIPYAYRARAPSFPSARLMAYFSRVAAHDAANPDAIDVEVDTETLSSSGIAASRFSLPRWA